MYTRGISVVYALLFLVVLVLTLVLHVFGNTLMNLLYGIENPVVVFLVDLIDLRGIILLAVQVLLFYGHLYGAAQQAQRVLEQSAGGGLFRRGLDGVLLGILHLCDPFYENLQYLRLGLLHCHQHALALLLCQYPVLRGGAE